jgi:hypothetical protein
MTIPKLIERLEIRLAYLKDQTVSYIQTDNTEMVLRLETEIAETEQTIEKLRNS